MNIQAMGMKVFFFNRKTLIYRDSTQDEVKRIWRHKIVCKESREYYSKKKLIKAKIHYIYV